MSAFLKKLIQEIENRDWRPYKDSEAVIQMSFPKHVASMADLISNAVDNGYDVRDMGSAVSGQPQIYHFIEPDTKMTVARYAFSPRLNVYTKE